MSKIQCQKCNDKCHDLICQRINVHCLEEYKRPYTRTKCCKLGLRKLPDWINCNKKQHMFICLKMAGKKKKKKKKGNVSKNFKTALSWYAWFMAWNNLVICEKTKVSQRLPKELDNSLMSFQKYVIDLWWQKEILYCHK